MAEPKIVTKFDAAAQPFPWQATLDNYDLGDPIGIGTTEQEAIDDLKSEMEMAK